MILIYALGAGYGHLTRTLKLIHQLDLGSVGLISNSPFASRITRSYNNRIELIHIPKFVPQKKLLMRHWLKDVINDPKITHLYMDAFPCGIQGELPLCEHVPITYLARLLIWENYRDYAKNANRFQQTYEMEPLAPAHHSWAKRHTLSYRPYPAKNLLQRFKSTTQNWCASQSFCADTADYFNQKYCLVIHSGSPEEQLQLIDYANRRMQYTAQRMEIVLISPARPPGLPADISHYRCYPASHWLKHASIVVSAAGFNIMQEMTAYPHPNHWVLPFKRRFDDQYFRFARYKESFERYTTAN